MLVMFVEMITAVKRANRKPCRIFHDFIEIVRVDPSVRMHLPDSHAEILRRLSLHGSLFTARAIVKHCPHINQIL
jgi:hypothetical protein